MDDSSLWYYLADEKQHGPVSFSIMCRLIEKGLLHHESHVIKAGDSEWSKLKEVAGLKEYLPKQPIKLKEEEPKADPVQEASRSKVSGQKRKRAKQESNSGASRIAFFPSRSFEFKWGFLILLACVSGAIAVQFVDLAEILPKEVDPRFLAKPVYAWCFAVTALNFIPISIYMLTRYFKNGIGWGIAILLIPFVLIFYIIGYWDLMKRPLFLSVINDFILFFCLYQIDPELLRALQWR